VTVRALPVNGRANEAVVALLAERLGIDASSIAVVSGHGSPAKVVAIDGIDAEAIRASFSSERPARAVSREPENNRVTRSPASTNVGCITIVHAATAQ
jgi:hypothetical protein